MAYIFDKTNAIPDRVKGLEIIIDYFKELNDECNVD